MIVTQLSDEEVNDVQGTYSREELQVLNEYATRWSFIAQKGRSRPRIRNGSST